MQDDARDESIAERIPQPSEVLGVLLGRGRVGLHFDSDDAVASEFGDEVDLVTTVFVARTRIPLCCISRRHFPA